jgi:hypothetical protein
MEKTQSAKKEKTKKVLQCHKALSTAKRKLTLGPDS